MSKARVPKCYFRNTVGRSMRLVTLCCHPAYQYYFNAKPGKVEEFPAIENVLACIDCVLDKEETPEKRDSMGFLESDPEPTAAEAKADVDRKMAGAYDDLAKAHGFLAKENESLYAENESCRKENEALRDCIRELIRCDNGTVCLECKRLYNCMARPVDAPCPIDAAWAKARELVGA